LTTFYHRQLRAAVEARYLAGSAAMERHQALAAYFAMQPWLLGPGAWNWRKVDEEVVQREGADDRAGAEQALSDLATALETTPWLQATDPDGIDLLVDALDDRLWLGGYWRVGERLFRLQLAARRALGDRDSEGAALNNLAGLAESRGELEAAQTSYEQALAIAREVGDRRGEGAALNNLADLAQSRGELEAAQTSYEQALAVLREVGDRRGEGTTLNNLGGLALKLGQPPEAVGEYYEQALAIRREVGDRAGEGTTLHNLGILAAYRGHPRKAREYFEQALAIRREVGDRAGEGITLEVLGGIADRVDDYEQAVRYTEQAVAIFEEIGAEEDAHSARRHLAGQVERRDRDAGTPPGGTQRRRWWPFGR
jgi:Tfp pilus assembly protein PilF